MFHCGEHAHVEREGRTDIDRHCSALHPTQVRSVSSGCPPYTWIEVHVSLFFNLSCVLLARFHEFSLDVYVARCETPDRQLHFSLHSFIAIVTFGDFVQIPSAIAIARFASFRHNQIAVVV